MADIENEGNQGKLGASGIQGPAGAQGVQGPQGPKGPTGIQGQRGHIGAQGLEGVSGVQGVQGKNGNVGLQGIRGCAGLQGPSGSNGVQGIQGKKGAQGFSGPKGIQGLDGVQGAQGPKGPVGQRGTMGYQGDDGRVGIQGLVGEDGAIWEEGIRLNGYNTHLFTFSLDANKFVSANESITDLLYIRNGARIAIWLDKDAYDAISVDNNIVIDKVENETITETSYPVYYANTKTLVSVINEETDLNTIVELTYKDEAWYYSGGLITPTITEDITVTGISIGQLIEGDIVETGTTIQELFEKLLTKEIDVHTVSPKLRITVNGDITSDGTYEVGDSLGGTISSVFTNGKFVGDEGYDYSIDAGCPEGDITYYQDSSVLINGIINITSLPEGDISFKAVETYGASTAEPITNIGNLSDKSISAGSVTSNTIKIHGKYKFYFGTQIATTESTVDDPTKFQFLDKESLSELNYGWLNNENTTTISSLPSTEDKPSFVIVIPEAWSIISTKNTMNQDVNVTTTWYRQNTITYTNGEVTLTYQVYVSPSTEASTYKEIVMSR